MALLCALLVVWWTSVSGKNFASLKAQADVGVTFFYAIIGTQITLILLAAPAATAGSICLDKARGTLSHVFVTDLSDSEIVLGKLVAKVLPALALVAATLPMMSLCTLLGGIDPGALLGAFLITLGLAVLGACVALAFSVWARKTHEVLLGTYAVWGLWLMVGPISSQLIARLTEALEWLDRTLHSSLAQYFDQWVQSLAALEYFDPYRLAFRPYTSPTTARFEDDVTFLIATLGLSAVLAAVSVWKLRPAYIKSLGQSQKRRPRVVMPRRLSRLRDALDGLPGPSLDGNPVLWREWHRQRASRLSRGVWLVYFGLAASFSVISFWTGKWGGYAAWVNGMQAAIGIMLLSVSASTSLAEERVRGSLDVLLATSLSTFTILSGKWLSTFRLVALLAILPTIVAATQVGPHDQAAWFVPLVPLFIVAYGAGATSLGLALATWVRQVGRAVGLCLAAVLFMTVGWLFICVAFSGHGFEESVGMGSPFMGLGEFTFDLADNRPQANINWVVTWILLYMTAAALLFALTMVTFDRCLGRVSNRLGSARGYAAARARSTNASAGAGLVCASPHSTG
jgi:ABC-type transport system involved in multi-copper enzyme maturation permease subunit